MSIPQHGHVNPSLGIVEELTNRGHRVTYAINDEFASQVSMAGAEPVLYYSTLPSASGSEPKQGSSFTRVRQLFLDETIAVTDQVERAYHNDRPDVIVYDMQSIYAQVLAKKWGIPYVQLSPTQVIFSGLDEDSTVLSTGKHAALRDRYNTYFSAQGVELTFDSMFAPPRVICTFPRSLRHRIEGTSGSHEFVGPIITDREFQGSWQPSNDSPVLLISLGSILTDQPEFYRKCMDAFAGLAWHVVMAIGHTVEVEQLGEVPSNFEVHPWVPQARVLSRASAFITHAGMGGISEGLYYEVPLIAAPLTIEQGFNAARIEELGVGVRINALDVTADKLRASLINVTSDRRLRLRLADLRREIHDAGGVRRAVTIIEECFLAGTQR
jgi:MGT family glycosyltransferase